MDLLELPVSITNYIVISDSLSQAKDVRLYIKLFHDYVKYLPIYKVEEVCVKAQEYLSEADYESVLNELWKCLAMM